jgi:hypothetical protein
MEIKMQTPYRLAFENYRAPVLSTEMIAQQLNDYVVPAITECFVNIINMVKSDFSIKNSVDAFKKREIAAEFTKLDTIITKRFGIPFKHIATTTKTSYAVFVLAPKINGILDRFIKEEYDYFKDYISTVDIKNTPSEQMISYDDQPDELTVNWIKGIDELEKTMNTTGVVVDLKKAYVHNYPQTATNFVMCDVYENIINYNWNANYFTAFLLHEIGHSFTATEYTYRTVRNTSVLLDSIQTTVMKQNKPLKEALLLAYSKAYGDVASKKLQNKNVVTVIVASAEAALFEFDAFSKSMYNAIDSEQLADQFSGRFGMGAYLAEALSNDNAIYYASKNQYQIEMLMSHGNIMLLIYMLALLTTGKLLLSGYIVIGGVIAYLLFKVVSIIFDAMSVAGEPPTARTYDDDKTRMIRIRHELVRQIRSYDLDKATIKVILERLDILDKIIAITPNNTKDGIINSIYLFFRKRNFIGKQLLEYDQFEQLIETLMENNLHVASAKIKSTL